MAETKFPISAIVVPVMFMTLLGLGIFCVIQQAGFNGFPWWQYILGIIVVAIIIGFTIGGIFNT